MELVKHETCEQYVARRLSEGWSIVWQSGHYLTLSSPDGNILRPVDLRNDVETLRPNAPGDECSIPFEKGAACPNHYQNVDEVSPDDSGTYVRLKTPYDTWKRDLYSLPASSGSGTINFIKIYFRCCRYENYVAYAKPSLKSNSTVTDGTQILPPRDQGWTTYSEQWNTNPANGQPWGSDWSVIDTLQIGVSLYSLEPEPVYCTQVYLEVDYTAVTEKTSSDTGSGADAKKTGNPLATMSKSDTGSGAEAIPARGIFLPEAGSGIDTILNLLGKTSSDVGTCSLENSYLHILAGVKSSSDSGSGVDASSLEALFQRAETGAGVEAVIARAIYSKEFPTGAIDLTKVLTATISGEETGTGVEQSLMSFYQKKADSGEGVDSSTLEALFRRGEAGGGVEAITVLAAMLASDSGQSVESVLNFLKKAIDSGEGSEVVQLIGQIGVMMELITYTQAPYDLRVYTSEVKQ